MKPKQIIITVIAAVLVILATVVTVRSCDKVHPVEHTVYVTDTITSIQWDTVYNTDIKTVKLPIHDTLNQYVVIDSVIVDSVFVDVPISRYRVDTTLQDDSTEIYLCISATGYDVKIDTIEYGFTYHYTTLSPPKKRNRLGFMVGIFAGAGYDPLTGKVVPAVGVGVGIGITTKKW